MINFITGLVSGVISGLGMGGGSILILILSNFLGVEQHIAQATNLIFFIPTSIVAIIIHWKNHNVDKKLAMKIIPMGIIGAIIGAYFTSKMNADSLRKYFGIFLLFVGVFEIFTKFIKYKKDKSNR